MTPSPSPKTTTNLSVLASLRRLIPHARLDYDDARAVAERQARLLRDRLGDLTEDTIGQLPRIRVVYETLPTSGLSYWNGREWIIALSETDSPARQRYTLLHEFKHVVDHGAADRLYRTTWEAERAADYFAACALMPKPELKRVFCTMTQSVARLADHFGVSQQAIRVRLEQTGLLDPVARAERCARPISTPPWQPQRFQAVPMHHLSLTRRSHA